VTKLPVKKSPFGSSIIYPEYATISEKFQRIIHNG